MPIQTIKISSGAKKAGVVAVAVLCLVGAYFAAKWGMVNSAAPRADSAELELYLTGLAPSDPQPHYAAAVFLEKSFAPDDIDRALKELEIATSLSPHNFFLWLDLGRARERNGDPQGAEQALRRAMELAPNYSRVQWAFGNTLLRQGRRDEAFAEINKAVSSDPTFAMPAAVLAWQFFDGDIDAIKRDIGNSSRFDAALAMLLVREGQFDQAMKMWRAIPAADKNTPAIRETGTGLFGKLLETKKFRYALEVSNDVGMDASNAEVGIVSNGGFEQPVKLEGAGVFEWQIAGGLQPQIVLSSGQKHGGNNSLLLVFNATSDKDFRSITKLVAVQPNTEYDLEIFYNADLKTAAAFRWNITDAADGKPIAATDPVALKSDWKALNVHFRSPSETDGIVLRFVREGCGQVCNVTGSLWFDDISLRAAR